MKTEAVFDSSERVAIPDVGVLESALILCKERHLGCRIERGGKVIGYCRRTASEGAGWSAYLTAEGQQ